MTIFPMSVVCLAAVCLTGKATGQTIAEALDTENTNWTSFGNVVPLAEPGQAHDGTDVLRLRLGSASPGTSGIQTTLPVVSVLDFYARSEGVDNYTTLSVASQEVVATFWKPYSFLADRGLLTISNTGDYRRGDLFLDAMRIRPASVVTLAEALDLPEEQGAVEEGDAITGFAESALAPDGRDAALVRGPARFHGPRDRAAVLTFVSPGPANTPAVVMLRPDGVPQPGIKDGIRTWIPLAQGFTDGMFKENPSNSAGGPGPPCVLDEVAFLPQLPLAEVLDAPSLTFTANARACGTDRTPDAADGDAALLCPRFNSTTAEGAGSISTTIPGPALLRFSVRGDLSVRINGTVHWQENAYSWRKADVVLPYAVNTVTWDTDRDYNFTGAWLDAVEVLPPLASQSPGNLLGLPGFVPEVLGDTVTGSDYRQALTIYSPTAGSAPGAQLRLPFPGPVLISMKVEDFQEKARLRVDEGAWHAPAYFGSYSYPQVTTLFAMPLAGAGPHTLDVSGPAALYGLEAIPLETIPLAEAVDVPTLAFRTSPEVPWIGYHTTKGMECTGGHAAAGGGSTSTAIPWIETTVTGPAVVSFRMAVSALGHLSGPSADSRAATMNVQGLSRPIWPGLQETIIGSGQQTIRWQAPPGQGPDRPGSLWWLDRVVCAAIPLRTVGEVLQTGNRAWMESESGGEILPAEWESAVEVKGRLRRVLFLPEPGLTAQDMLRLETRVQLPCLIEATGENLTLSTASGHSPVALGLNGYATSAWTEIQGAGSAILTIKLANPLIRGELHGMRIRESANAIAAPSLTFPQSGASWRKLSGASWPVYQETSSEAPLYQVRPGEWLETTVQGPCYIPADQNPFSVIILPDKGNRPAGKEIFFNGPQRILARAGNNASLNLLNGNLFRPGMPLGPATGAPKLVWSTGGDIPWAAFSQGRVTSPPLRPGETSWLEVQLPGPGVLRWFTDRIGNYTSAYVITPLLDGVVVPHSASTYLHIGPGLHTMRWEASLSTGTARSIEPVERIRGIDFTQQFDGSLAETLTEGGLSFVEWPKVSYYSSGNQSYPVPWPLNASWLPSRDAARPTPVLVSAASPGYLAPVAGVPGILSMAIKMERNGSAGSPVMWPQQGSGYTHPAPAMAAPFPWQLWSRADRSAPLPVRTDGQTSIDDAVFHPDSIVGLGDALDQPALTWSAGGSRTELWQARSGPGSGHEDPGAVWLQPMGVGETAWLETSLTGPLVIETLFSDAGWEVGYGLQIDGAPLPVSLSDDSTVHTAYLPPGPHQVRWSARPIRPVYAGQAHGIRRIKTRAFTAPVPDAAALLDSPGLAWASSVPSQLRAAAVSFDGEDALQLPVTSADALVVSLEGPGIATFMAGHQLLTGPTTCRVGLDNLQLTLPALSSSPRWSRFQVCIPQGRHALRFPPNSASTALPYLDQFSYQILPVLPAGQALDLPAGHYLRIPDETLTGAASWPDLSENGGNSLLLVPGLKPVSFNAPPDSVISFRVRSVGTTAGLMVAGQAVAPPGPAWSSRSVTTAGNGLTTIDLVPSNGAVLMGNLVISKAVSGNQYFQWAESAGLAAGQQRPEADPDGDGLNNALEYSTGSDPLTAGQSVEGSTASPGFPVTGVGADPLTGEPWLEIAYWKHSVQTAYVETAQDPSVHSMEGFPQGWTVSNLPGTLTSPGPSGWNRVVWRTPVAAIAGGRCYVRVRYGIP